jgi:5'-nucleotidase
MAEASGAKGNLIGGLSLLSGYINRVRREEKNVLYVIAGDMVQGSMIDSEFKGVSTMEIMNYLSPDVVTLGNHELDYGLGHLLFLEKMANFPIVNANLYLKKYHKRLMQPYVILNVDGFDVMFIGIVTQAVLGKLQSDDIGTFVGLEDAAAEVGKICNAYKDEDIDLTVLLTHIGFDEDKKLAAMLDPAWGVDMIIGGHSHTVLDQPAEINNILIAQAGTGTDQIGRFDIVVDDDTNSITEWKWRLIPVNNDLAEPDRELQTFIDSFQDVVERKYKRILSRMTRKLTHPIREQETELGNLIADIIAERAGVDVAFVASAAIRGSELGPIVTLGDLVKVFPYNDQVLKSTVTGAQLLKIFEYICVPENRHEDGHVYQFNAAVRLVYNDTRRAVESLTVRGEAVQPDRHYSIYINRFVYKSCTKKLNLTDAELTALGKPQIVATSDQDLLEEYFVTHPHLDRHIEGRLVFIK